LIRVHLCVSRSGTMCLAVQLRCSELTERARRRYSDTCLCLHSGMRKSNFHNLKISNQFTLQIPCPVFSRTVWATLPMFTIINILTVLVGMVVVSKYRGCSPILTQRVVTADQLFPLFVMDTMGHIPGIPGIFVAGIFSASLSTVSSTINSVTAVILEDIVKLMIWPKITEAQAVKLLKILSAAFGLVCILAATMAKSMGNIVQASMFVFGLLGAPMFGTFMFGLFFPWGNLKVKSHPACLSFL